ncbi:MAG: LamG domain-containing protein, partial [Myxococcaceae bacterium]|nr:LamG domain-containing protein [Myxococcaceae bacterium]
QVKALGFDQVMLPDLSWLASTGLIDARPGIAKVVTAFHDAKLAVTFHTLASEMSVFNPICGVSNQDPAPPTCASGAWAIGADGQPMPSGYGTANHYLWNVADRALLDRVAANHAAFVREVKAEGLYADGADWFGAVNPFGANAYYKAFAAAAPELELRGAVGPSSAQLFMGEQDMTDQWQVNLSVDARSWALNFGYPMQRGWLSHLGTAPRVGWVPPPPQDLAQHRYLPMLNGAVAAGAHVTLQAGFETNVQSQFPAWFPDAMRRTNEAVAEVRGGDSRGTVAARSARHDLIHFDNGVSTLALFDGVVPGARGSAIEGRMNDVDVLGANKCDGLNRCFRFHPSPRMPHYDPYTATPLPREGSVFEVPGGAALAPKSFTIGAWFAADEATSSSLMEKGPNGFGLFYWRDAQGQSFVSGHMTGGNPWSWNVGAAIPAAGPGVWQHVVYAYDDATKTFTQYNDGVLTLHASNPARGPSVADVEPSLYLGGGSSPYGGTFGGRIRDARVYGRALSSAEVTAWKASGADVPGLVAAFDATAVKPGRGFVVAELGEQRVVYLVPMSRSGALPDERIQLRFEGARRPAHVTSRIAPAAVYFELGGPLVVEFEAAALDAHPLRVQVR